MLLARSLFALMRNRNAFVSARKLRPPDKRCWRKVRHIALDGIDIQIITVAAPDVEERESEHWHAGPECLDAAVGEIAIPLWPADPAWAELIAPGPDSDCYDYYQDPMRAWLN